MNTPEQRLEIAGKILSGFAANPAIFATNSNCGWAIVNASNSEICTYAMELADILIECEHVTTRRLPLNGKALG